MLPLKPKPQHPSPPRPQDNIHIQNVNGNININVITQLNRGSEKSQRQKLRLKHLKMQREHIMKYAYNKLK